MNSSQEKMVRLSQALSDCIDWLTVCLVDIRFHSVHFVSFGVHWRFRFTYKIAIGFQFWFAVMYRDIPLLGSLQMASATVFGWFPNSTRNASG